MARRFAPLLLAPLALSSCTLVNVKSGDEPSRLESDGLIDGHLAFGFRSDARILHVSLFDGTSPGALAEFELWKLFRFELGLAGIGLGIGPVDAALGVAFYEPEVPRMGGHPSALQDALDRQLPSAPKVPSLPAELRSSGPERTQSSGDSAFRPYVPVEDSPRR